MNLLHLQKLKLNNISYNNTILPNLWRFGSEYWYWYFIRIKQQMCEIIQRNNVTVSHTNS